MIISSAMFQKIQSAVSVISVYNHISHEVKPYKILWNGRSYLIKKIGLHHTYREGRTLLHIFSVQSDTLYFKLICNTDTLHWTLEEIADGESN